MQQQSVFRWMHFGTLYVQYCVARGGGGGYHTPTTPQQSSNIARTCLQQVTQLIVCSLSRCRCLCRASVCSSCPCRWRAESDAMSCDIGTWSAQIVPAHAACGADAASFRFPLPEALCHFELQIGEWKNLVENAIKMPDNKNYRSELKWRDSLAVQSPMCVCVWERGETSSLVLFTVYKIFRTRTATLCRSGKKITHAPCAP